MVMARTVKKLCLKSIGATVLHAHTDNGLRVQVLKILREDGSVEQIRAYVLEEIAIRAGVAVT